MGKEGWPVATREELKQLIDGMPDEALPFIQETLKRWTPRATTSDCEANGPMGNAMTSMTVEFVDTNVLVYATIVAMSAVTQSRGTS